MLVQTRIKRLESKVKNIQLVFFQKIHSESSCDALHAREEVIPVEDNDQEETLDDINAKPKVQQPENVDGNQKSRKFKTIDKILLIILSN